MCTLIGTKILTVFEEQYLMFCPKVKKYFRMIILDLKTNFFENYKKMRLRVLNVKLME